MSDVWNRCLLLERRDLLADLCDSRVGFTVDIVLSVDEVYWDFINLRDVCKFCLAPFWRVVVLTPGLESLFESCLTELEHGPGVSGRWAG